MSSPPPLDTERSGWFATTHWSVVQNAKNSESPLCAEALDRLCRQYWPPVYAFVRRRGHGPSDAQDLTQEFFSRLIGKNYLQAADAAKGKFRTLLLTAVTRFLINERERALAQKRGGGAVHLPLEPDSAEQGYHVEPADPATPETIYDRRYAETLLEIVLGRLRSEFEAAGERQRFEVLKCFLATERGGPSGAEVAAQLGVSETAAYSAIHRLRRRYGELLWEEVAHTVTRPEEIEDELRHLARVLGE